MSQRIADLTRRERVVKQSLAEIRQHQAQVSELHQKVANFEQQQQVLAEAIKADPWGTLKKFGVDTYQALAQFGGKDSDAAKPDPQLATALEELAQLKRRLDEKDKAAEEQQRQTHQQNVYQQALGQIHGIVSATPDDFEAVLDRGREGVEAVFQALDTMYQELAEQGMRPGPPGPDDIKSAAKIVEKAFREQEIAELQRQAGRKRFAGRLSLGEPTTTVEPAKASTAAIPSVPTTTLTNDLDREAPQKKKLPLSDEELLAAALSVPFPFSKSG